MKKSVALISGGFDPLHRGHISYINSAKEFSDYLIFGLNSDDWLIRKKQLYFMNWYERASIIENLSSVDKVIQFNDDDDSACDAIVKSLEISEKVIFCNGGDRSNINCKELDVFNQNKRVDFQFGVGGSDKLNSSSWMINDFIKKFSEASNQKISSNNELIHAPWGSHLALLDKAGYKFKELKVNPNSKLSLQKHLHREEFWVVHKGSALVEIDGVEKHLNEGEIIHVPKESKHRISNISAQELVILEIQRGDILEEEDIVRYEDQYGRTS